MKKSGHLCLLILAAFVLGCASSSYKTIETRTDERNYYGTGSGESKDKQIAVDKAMLAARNDIARQIEISIDGMQKSFAEEIGSGADTELISQYTSVTKAVVSVTMKGSVPKEQKSREKKGVYQAEVTVEYPKSAAKQQMLDEIKKNEALHTRFQASRAFAELEQELSGR